MRLIYLAFLPAAVYQALAVFAGLRHLVRRAAHQPQQPSPGASGVSVLKPLRGLDPNTYSAFVSQARQNYPRFEILFGVREESDPVVPLVRRLQAEFPTLAIQLVVGAPDTPNGKAGTLIELARHATYSFLVVNDGDIEVGPSYLSEVIAPLADPNVGIVTCPYRAKPHTVPAFWEALGIATDFTPSTLVAQLLGVREFGFGSTLAFRAADLKTIGGFATISAYLADDYQLARHITGLGKRAVLSTYTVETSLVEASWRGVWNHQLRWARTIRFSKGAGYAGLPFTHAGVWASLAFLLHLPQAAVVLIVLRTLSAFVAGGGVLKQGLAAVFCWLAPVWDLYAFCVWAASYAGREVRWRDKILHIDPAGRIQN